MKRQHGEARKTTTRRRPQQREALRKAIAFKSYEFNCHGVEMNQRYESTRSSRDGTPEPAWQRDKELYYQASTRPGAHLPHVWVFDRDHRESLDAGPRRQRPLHGADRHRRRGLGRSGRAIAAESGLDIQAFVIGPGRDFNDFAGDWARACEIEEAGCLLVRPDQFVAFRSQGAPTDAHAQLTRRSNRCSGARFRRRRRRWAPAIRARRIGEEQMAERAWTKYPYFEEETSAEVVIARMAPEISPRVREVMSAVDPPPARGREGDPRRRTRNGWRRSSS